MGYIIISPGLNIFYFVCIAYLRGGGGGGVYHKLSLFEYFYCICIAYLGGGEGLSLTLLV